MKKTSINCIEDNYYLKEVVPHFISSNAFTPGESPTPTNVGIVLAKRIHPSGMSIVCEYQFKFFGLT